MTKSIILYKVKNTDINLTITAYIKNMTQLDIEYYDIGGPYGDYERHLTLTKGATQKLCQIYNCNIHNLLKKIEENFSGESCNRDFQEFCDKNDLKYDTFIWND